MNDILTQIVTQLRDDAPQPLVAAGVLLVLVGAGHLVGLASSRLLLRARRDDRYARLTRGVVRDLVGSWMELQAHLWVDSRDPERADASLSQVRTRAMAAARHALREAGFTLSPDTTTALAVHPVDVRVTTDTEPTSDPGA